MEEKQSLAAGLPAGNPSPKQTLRVFRHGDIVATSEGEMRVEVLRPGHRLPDAGAGPGAHVLWVAMSRSGPNRSTQIRVMLGRKEAENAPCPHPVAGRICPETGRLSLNRPVKTTPAEPRRLH